MNLKVLTVAELIAKLQALVDANPQVADFPTLSEGCDCNDDCKDVILYDTFVLLARGR